MSADAVSTTDDETLWDVIVVGTGMGGGTLGLTLALTGHRVLFLEKGHAHVTPHDPGTLVEQPDARLGYGHWPDRVWARVDSVNSESFFPLGCGVGGSTLLYAAALERFDPIDFRAPADGSGPEEDWPVSYQEMRPFYERAERLYAVRGTRDPIGEPDGPAIRRPPPASMQDDVFMRDFARAGLHPYRLHVGMDYVDRCAECVGRACPVNCKKDAANSAVVPAIAAGAALRADCEVVRILANDRRAEAVEYRQDGSLRRARARVIVLSAGTFRSPALLLVSADAQRPAGLANSSGLVGRYLTFHGWNWFAIWPSRRAPTDGPRKTIAFRDLYELDGERLGQFQSTGLPAGYGNILVYLYTLFDRSPFGWARWVRPLLRIPARIAARLFGPATIFAMIIEDAPSRDNRIEVDPVRPEQVRIVYTVSDVLRRRTQLARTALRNRLRGFRLFPLGLSAVSLDFGHATGTCRMGIDPRTSVLDPSCRTHDLDNLYVVDGSFMPSGGGTNPSLTIAANAIRVGEIIGERLRAGVV